MIEHIITVVAVIAFFIFGASLDSESVVIPMIGCFTALMVLLVMSNREEGR